jgi:hypothetical protein
MTDITDIIAEKSPRTSVEAWTQYPKFNKVQQTSILFDFQHVEWQPFADDKFNVEHDAYNIEGYTGKIYTKELKGDELTTYVAINKGEIKWIAHAPKGTYAFEEEIRGSLELRIGAFITTVYKKFSGIVSFDSVGDDVVAVNMHINKDFAEAITDEDLAKNIKRLYSRREWK